MTNIWEAIKKFFAERGGIGDKALHIFCSLVITAFLVTQARSHGHHPMNGVLVAFVIGLVWEAIGVLRKRPWDWQDILADAIGCGVGALFTGAWMA